MAKCPICGGTGDTTNNIPPTNEQWFCALSTEEKADVFFDYRYANATPRQKLWMSASEECIKTDIVKWLKEIHKE